SGMRIDIIHLIWGDAGMLERQLHRARGAFAARRRRRHMVGVGRKTVSCDFAVNFCAARLGMFQFFHHHDSSTFAHHKAVAVTIKWPGSALGLVVTRAERSHRREPGKTDLDNRSLRTAGKENIGITKLYDPPGFTDCVV